MLEFIDSPEQSDYSKRRLIGIKTVTHLTSLSKSSIYHEISEGTFPEPLRLTKARVAWVELEVLDWIDKKFEQRSKLLTARAQAMGAARA